MLRHYHINLDEREIKFKSEPLFKLLIDEVLDGNYRKPLI